jgi:sugar fermentation stimulation protein A
VEALPSLEWGAPLTEARFVERPNRFVVYARVGGREPVAAHLPDPGRLRELLVPGRRVGLRPEAPSRGRATRWTVLLVEGPDGSGWVSVHTALPNRLVRAALEAGALPEFDGWEYAGREVPYGRSRLDFLLSDARGRRQYVEVKSVTLVHDGLALFPDAVTARGTRHVEELIDAVERGHDAAVLFVLQRPDAGRVIAARSIDPAFSDAMERAQKAGVRVLGRRCHVTWRGIALGDAVPAGAG